MSYQRIRPLLFRLDPEQVHDWIIRLMWLVGNVTPLRKIIENSYRTYYKAPITVAGLQFKNPIGLAAGFDKDAQGWRGLAALGFGHIELGTVTLKPQPGNPKPRIFRIPAENALINRMGFPGQGSEIAYPRIKKNGKDVILGVNIGKNKATPNEEAHQEYASLFRLFAPVADYIAINVSSPNTIGLRDLQVKNELNRLLGSIIDEKRKSPDPSARSIPIFVKISPDLTDSALDDVLDCIASNQMDGIIATNTTIRRDILNSEIGKQTGGLSGEPLKAISTEIIRKIHQRTQGQLPIIGVGGVITAEDAREKLDAGASLVQIYTGLIYQGPGIVQQILREL